MDPNATLIRLLEAIAAYRPASGDLYADALAQQSASDALDDILGWIHRGGFKPDTEVAIEALRAQSQAKQPWRRT